MRDEQSLQDSLDKLTGEAAEEMAKAAEDMNNYGRIGGGLAGEEEALEADNQPEPQDAGSESQPPESPPVEESFLEKKYGKDNWKEADRGYLNLQDTLKAERAQRELERQQYTQYIQSFQQPKQETVDPLKQLEDVGIPGDVLGAAIDARALQQVQAILGPLVAEAQAEQILQSRPGFNAAEYQAAQRWAQEDPMLKAQVDRAGLQAATPENRAMIKDYVLMKYRENQGGRAQEAIRSNADAREAIVNESRKDAGIVKSKNSPSRVTRKVDTRFVDNDEMEKIKRLAHLGYGQRASGKLLGPSLPDEYFE